MPVSDQKPAVFYELNSRKDCVVDYDPEWEAWYNKTLKCSYCGWPDPRKVGKATPIDVLVQSMPKGSAASADAFPKLLHHDLLELLQPYFEDIFVGECHVRHKGKETIETPYTTLFTPYKHVVDAHRGKYCRHTECPGCHTFANSIGWASGAIVRRYIKGRRIFLDVLQSIYVEDKLAEELSLKALFPDLILYEFPVIEEPLDGDTLPGDPGWNGVFKPRRSPRLPPGKPPKGRWTY